MKYDFAAKFDVFASKISRLTFSDLASIFYRIRGYIYINVFAAIFGNKFYNLASNLCPISQLMRTD